MADYTSNYTGQEIDARLGLAESAYQKPAAGVPKNDLAQGVQTSLDKADTALQSIPDTYRTAAAQDVIDSAIEADIDAIEGKIPAQASESNQLADKNFVNSSIATNTAAFRGTFNCTGEGAGVVLASRDEDFPTSPAAICGALGENYQHSSADFNDLFYYEDSGVIKILQGDVLIAEIYDDIEESITLIGNTGSITLNGSYNGGSFSLSLSAADALQVNDAIGILNAITWDGDSGYTANDNDYAFVAVKESGNTLYKRYKWESEEDWAFEYALNNSSFTASQWAAINSGITATSVAGFEQKSNKKTSISASSTDTEYPSAKCVYDQLGGLKFASVSALPASPDANTIYFITE